MGRGLPYRFFDAVARYPYSVADVIGVQTPGNKGYFAQWTQRPGRRLEVLQNWLGAPADAPSTIVVGDAAGERECGERPGGFDRAGARRAVEPSPTVICVRHRRVRALRRSYRAVVARLICAMVFV